MEINNQIEKETRWVLMDAEQDPELPSFGKYAFGGTGRWTENPLNAYYYPNKAAARAAIVSNQLINALGCMPKPVALTIRWSVEQNRLPPT